MLWSLAVALPSGIVDDDPRPRPQDQPPASPPTPPVEQQDDLTQAFEALKATCEEPVTTKAHWRDGMSDSTWLLIKQRTSLHRAGQRRQVEGRRMQRAFHAALKRDHAARTAQIGESIVAELAEGNVHEAFQHLKGWYRQTSETQARPCFQTME